MAIIDNVTGLPIPEIVLLQPLDPLQEAASCIHESIIRTSAGRSTKAKTVNFRPGTTFYNAVNTAKDKLVLAGRIQTQSNISVWRQLTGITAANAKCLNVNCRTLANNPQNTHGPYDLVGAHVVLDPGKIKVQDGDTLYLIPICRSCNGRNAPIVIRDKVTALVLMM